MRTRQHLTMSRTTLMKLLLSICASSCQVDRYEKFQWIYVKRNCKMSLVSEEGYNTSNIALKIENTTTVKYELSSRQTFLHIDKNSIGKFKHAIKKFIESIRKERLSRYYSRYEYHVSFQIKTTLYEWNNLIEVIMFELLLLLDQNSSM